MNNVQLVVFLEKYNILLSRSVDDIEKELPREMMVTSKNILGMETESFPILSPLYEILNLLDDDIEFLKKGIDNEK